MTETYTFSRALHLMRYGGKKMRYIGWKPNWYIRVEEERIIDREGDTILTQNGNALSSKELMGNWVEVKG